MNKNIVEEIEHIARHYKLVKLRRRCRQCKRRNEYEIEFTSDRTIKHNKPHILLVVYSDMFDETITRVCIESVKPITRSASVTNTLYTYSIKDTATPTFQRSFLTRLSTVLGKALMKLESMNRQVNKIYEL